MGSHGGNKLLLGWTTSATEGVPAESKVKFEESLPFKVFSGPFSSSLILRLFNFFFNLILSFLFNLH